MINERSNEQDVNNSNLVRIVRIKPNPKSCEHNENFTVAVKWPTGHGG